jgi:hypothetical protein
MPLFAVTVFLSAFLLFQIQPIVAKMILPWFGGSSSVWSTCLVFFQAELLLGYLYVHWLHETLAPRRQTLVHCIPAAGQSGDPAGDCRPGVEGNGVCHPTWNVLGVLAGAVGMPYLLLSTTGPLMQAWYARSVQRPDALPAVCAVEPGIDARLLSYPVLVEPYFLVCAAGLGLVGRLCLFVLACLGSAWQSWKGVSASARRRAGCGRGLAAPGMARVPAVGRPGDDRLDPAAGDDPPPDAGRGAGAFPVGAAAEPLPAEFHPLLRRAALLLPAAVPGGAADRLLLAWTGFSTAAACRYRCWLR